MRNLILTAILVFKISSSYALNIEEKKIYGKQNASSDLNILSSTDINIFDEVMTNFSELNSDLNVTYTVASTKDIYEVIYNGSTEFDIVMSSAMDLQIKLANDGLVHPYKSSNTELIPEWASWQNEIYGFAIEPVVMVISKSYFENYSLPKPIDRRGFLNLLKDHEILFSNKIITYDINSCLLYTSPSPRDLSTSRMPSSA